MASIQAPNRTQDISAVQLALLLNGVLNSNNERNVASATAQRAAADMDAEYRALTGSRDNIDALMASLMQSLSEAPGGLGELNEDAIRQREMERFSRLAPSVDRAHALAASQGFAKALRGGMSDSTQAANMAGDLTRQFSDVYSKLQENARTEAFKEALDKFKAMQQDKQTNAQTLGQAANALNSYQARAWDMNKWRGEQAASAVKSSGAAWGDALMRFLDSGVGKRLAGAIDEKVNGWMDSGKSTGYDGKGYDVNAASNARLQRQEGVGGYNTDPWGDMSYAEQYTPEPAPVNASTDWEMPSYEWQDEQPVEEDQWWLTAPSNDEWWM